MTAALIDGKALGAALRARVAEDVRQLKESRGITPGLAVVLVGDDPASEIYVRNKEKAVAEAGMASFPHHLPANTSQDELLALIGRLNADAAVHGILVQLPLPETMDAGTVLMAVDPRKDVDGFHPVNAGLLASGRPGLAPCTPLGCMRLIQEVESQPEGLNAVVVGRSNIVGKPVAQLLLAANCTVTIAHSRTRDLPDVCARADILVAAVGRPQMIKGSWIKDGAIVIDVGINRIARPGGQSGLTGDVEFDAAKERARAITPVPGGVGPMTIACLMANTLKAAKER